MPTPQEQYNIDLANRQIEINEWSYNNKRDTLYIFQLSFIALIFIAILSALEAQGIIGGAFVSYVIFLTLLVLGIIIINRIFYTDRRRDARYWNRRRFGDDSKQESPLSRGDSSLQDYIDAIRRKYSSRQDTAAACAACPQPR